MCDRCASGLWFFGLAEPQFPMLESYRAAVSAGWAASSASPQRPALEVLRNIDADQTMFITTLRDRIHTSPTRLHLTRWMWDGEFCGEIRIAIDGESAADCSLNISVVPWKAGHNCEARAVKQLRDELKALAIDANCYEPLFATPLFATP